MNVILWALVVLLLVCVAALANHSFGWWEPGEAYGAWMANVRARLGALTLTASLLLAAVGTIAGLGNAGRFWHVSWNAVCATFIPLVMILAWVVSCLDRVMREEGWDQ